MILLKLIKKRSLLVNEVLKVKIYKKEIIDKTRITIYLKKLKKNQSRLKLIQKLQTEFGKI